MINYLYAIFHMMFYSSNSLEVCEKKFIKTDLRIMSECYLELR